MKIAVASLLLVTPGAVDAFACLSPSRGVSAPGLGAAVRGMTGGTAGSSLMDDRAPPSLDAPWGNRALHKAPSSASSSSSPGTKNPFVRATPGPNGCYNGVVAMNGGTEGSVLVQGGSYGTVDHLSAFSSEFYHLHGLKSAAPKSQSLFPVKNEEAAREEEIPKAEAPKAQVETPEAAKEEVAAPAAAAAENPNPTFPNYAVQ